MLIGVVFKSDCYSCVRRSNHTDAKTWRHVLYYMPVVRESLVDSLHKGLVFQNIGADCLCRHPDLSLRNKRNSGRWNFHFTPLLCKKEALSRKLYQHIDGLTQGCSNSLLTHYSLALNHRYIHCNLYVSTASGTALCKTMNNLLALASWRQSI